jgi:5-hydroxyisourate hydrolase
MGKLTTHVLDTAQGRPAAGMAFALYRIEGEQRRLLKQGTTNADGRADAPLLADADLSRGEYELVFGVAAYFQAQGIATGEPAFLSSVPLRFGIAAPEQHYHVPLLVSPWSYSTYRGS